MSTGVSTGSTTTVVHQPKALVRTSTLSTKSRAQHGLKASTEEQKSTRSHYKPMHTGNAASILSPVQGRSAPSFAGFQNLAMIVLIVGNLRLVVENYQNYGFLKRIITLGLSRHDAYTAALLTASVPVHLFLALLIERLASTTTSAAPVGKDKNTEHKPKHYWRLFAFLHAINATLVLGITSYTVFFNMRNPMMGTICEFHAIVLCLKVASYALTNRDLRDSYIDQTPLPPLYQSLPYPRNLTLRNLVYFWWAPTLVYQPVYPRSPRVRKGFVVMRIVEIVLSAVGIWFLSSQYATPILEKSLKHFETKNVLKIAERLMKLSTVSIIIWLLGFFMLFQSYLNLLAELLQFGDRAFYEDFWNCHSVGAYWKMWNKPVHNYFIRHIYIPLLKRGWNTVYASTSVFLISAVLHEIVVGIPTHNFIGIAFMGMILQVPLVVATAPLEKMGHFGHLVGNCVFWFSFFLGQPTAVLLYYFAWNVKYGSLAQR